jgi:hypothetical protein
VTTDKPVHYLLQCAHLKHLVNQERVAFLSPNQAVEKLRQIGLEVFGVHAVGGGLCHQLAVEVRCVFGAAEDIDLWG